MNEGRMEMWSRRMCIISTWFSGGVFMHVSGIESATFASHASTQ